MKKLKPIKLHALLGSAPEWTDDLWQEALRYLLENTATHDAIIMASFVHEGRIPNYPHKIDFLRDFQDYPPTMLLGAFDFRRAQKAGR